MNLEIPDGYVSLGEVGITEVLALSEVLPLYVVAYKHVLEVFVPEEKQALTEQHSQTCIKNLD